MNITYVMLMFFAIHYCLAEDYKRKCFLYECNNATVRFRYYPRYHLAPCRGWMNDPNGFSFFEGYYHLFYQFNPCSSLEPGTAHWGHVKSKDLFHWIDLPIALYPNSSYDAQGVFSGSAVIDNGTMNLFYTGNGNTQVQALATSSDGVHVKKYEGNPIILGQNYQPNFRDPKVWIYENNWYMVLGNSFEETDSSNNDTVTLGRALLFKSPDRYNWEQVSVLDESKGFLGYMWECPDFFELDGRHVLLFSPQGVKPQGDRFRNIYQTGYIIGGFNYTTNIFTPETEFKELDFGHDFYATQTMLDGSGRRLLVAWMDIWKQDYPEEADGFTGQMTIIRTLSLNEDNQLVQEPAKEIASIRGNILFEGKASGGTSVTLENKAGEILIEASVAQNFTLYFESNNTSVRVKYESTKGKISLDRGGQDGLRRTDYSPRSKLKLRFLIDASSVELFCGKGEVTLSSRFFPDGNITVRLEAESVADSLKVQTLERTLYLPSC